MSWFAYVLFFWQVDHETATNLFLLSKYYLAEMKKGHKEENKANLKFTDLRSEFWSEQDIILITFIHI